MRDPDAIARLWPHAVGDRVALPIGATLDPEMSSPLPKWNSAAKPK